jgi:hypothetical protein
MQLYKIINKDGKFSSGGLYPYFRPKGKIWTSKKNLDAHIRMLVSEPYDQSYLYKFYTGCSVFIIDCAGEYMIPMQEYMNTLEQK